jgi:hypothetical protein
MFHSLKTATGVTDNSPLSLVQKVSTCFWDWAVFAQSFIFIGCYYAADTNTWIGVLDVVYYSTFYSSTANELIIPRCFITISVIFYLP